MTGGNVQLNASTSGGVTLEGRVSSAGAKVAPASAGKFTSAKSSTGVYTITPFESYAEYLGCQITLESASGAYYTAYNATTNVITVSTFAVDGSTVTDKAFKFTASFTENKAP